MRATGAALIAMGFGCLFFAFLGWWGNRGSFQGDAERSSVAERRAEFVPMAADRYGRIYARAARPLTWGGAIGVFGGIALVVIDLAG